jgi:hypothetical protein
LIIEPPLAYEIWPRKESEMSRGRNVEMLSRCYVSVRLIFKLNDYLVKGGKVTHYILTQFTGHLTKPEELPILWVVPHALLDSEGLSTNN